MKVLQVSKFYHPVVGGIERVVQQLSEGLRERGHESRVLASAKQGFGTNEPVEGVPVRRASSFGTLLSVPIAPAFPHHLSQMVSGSDIVHYHLPNPSTVVSHLLIRPSVPTVVTYHSDIVRQTQALTVYKPILKRFLSSVDHIITTSPRLRGHSIFLREHQSKTTVVPLSVNPDIYDESGPVNGPSLPTDGPTVLFVGRLNYYKGVTYLIRAIQHVDGAELVVAGDGDQRTSLERQAVSLGVEDRVYFHGYIDDKKLREYYRSADLFVLPSVESSEAFGIVQLEAMVHGLPVINTDLPTGVPWVSRDRKTGLTVPPRDADALASAIQELLVDDELRESLGRNARQRVETKFTEARMLSQTLDVYAEVIG